MRLTETCDPGMDPTSAGRNHWVDVWVPKARGTLKACGLSMQLTKPDPIKPSERRCEEHPGQCQSGRTAATGCIMQAYENSPVANAMEKRRVILTTMSQGRRAPRAMMTYGQFDYGDKLK